MPEKECLFTKPLSKHSIGAYRELFEVWEYLLKLCHFPTLETNHVRDQKGNPKRSKS